MSSTPAWDSAFSDQLKTGTPNNPLNCLGISPPVRSPRPAATIRAETLMFGENCTLFAASQQ
jgi:hypothetical protein